MLLILLNPWFLFTLYYDDLYYYQYIIYYFLLHTLLRIIIARLFWSIDFIVLASAVHVDVRLRIARLQYNYKYEPHPQSGFLFY